MVSLLLQLNILQLIEDGSAKGSGLSLSVDEILRAIQVIAEKYRSVKKKMIITPRFTRPLAADYSKIVLSKEFPSVSHGCGAGINFAFIDNKGRIYPCDRLRNQEIDGSLFQLSDRRAFNQIWNSEVNAVPMAILESEKYNNLTPCNKCQYFKKKCFPCPLQLPNNLSIDECHLLLEKIREKRFAKIETINCFSRVVERESSSHIILNTLNGRAISVDQNSLRLFRTSFDEKINNYYDLKIYSINNSIDIEKSCKFVEYLFERGFVSLSS